MSTAKQFLKAENKFTAQLLNTMDWLIDQFAQNNIASVSLNKQLKSRSAYIKIGAPVKQMYELGITDAAKEVEFQYSGDMGMTNALENLKLSKLTEHTIQNLSGFSKSIKGALESSMSEGRRLGEDYGEIATRIQDVWDVERPRAMMLARTEGNEIYNQAHLGAYKSSGVVDAVQFVAVNDERTSDLCRMLDGTIWRIDDPDIMRPPLHFYCIIAGTKVQTINGEKNIEDVQIGDLVLTHTGMYNPVRETMNRIAPEVIEIKTRKRMIHITPEHPILVKRNRENQWIEAGKLKEGDEIVISD